MSQIENKRLYSERIMYPVGVFARLPLMHIWFINARTIIIAKRSKIVISCESETLCIYVFVYVWSRRISLRALLLLLRLGHSHCNERDEEAKEHSFYIYATKCSTITPITQKIYFFSLSFIIINWLLLSILIKINIKSNLCLGEIFKTVFSWALCN